MGGFIDIANTIKPPENPVAQLGGALAIKGQLQSQQMGALQLEQAKLAQQSQATLMRLFARNNGDMNQTYADAADSGQVLPEHLIDFRTKSVAAQVQAAQLTKEDLANRKSLTEMAANELDSIKNLPPERIAPAIKDSIGRLLQAGGPNMAQWLIPVAQDLVNNPTPENFQRHEMALMGETWVTNNALKGLELASKPTAAQAQAKTAAELDKSQTDALMAHRSLLNLPTPEEAKTKRMADLRETMASTAQKQADTAEKIASTALIGAQPVFAFDPATNQRVLSTMPQAGAKGFTNPVKASEGDINKETELTRQFNDVQMNVSRFRVAMNNPRLEFGQNGLLSASDTTKIASILSDKGLAGVAGQIPAGERLGDIISQGKNAQYWNELSPEAQDAVTGYLRAKGSIIAFQKALTQTGRTSKEALAIEMQNLPSPLMAGPAANKQLDAFQENIDTASKGIVRVPWLPTTQDVRQNIEGQAAKQAAQDQAASRSQAAAQAGERGQYRNAAGRPMQVGQEAYDNATKRFLGTVSRVYADGSYDIKPG
jgi:hypothetical protein